jgi:hypothetical protein
MSFRSTGGACNIDRALPAGNSSHVCVLVGAVSRFPDDTGRRRSLTVLRLYNRRIWPGPWSASACRTKDGIGYDQQDQEGGKQDRRDKPVIPVFHGAPLNVGREHTSLSAIAADIAHAMVNKLYASAPRTSNPSPPLRPMGLNRGARNPPKDRTELSIGG